MLIWTIAHEFSLTLFCCSPNIFHYSSAFFDPKTHVSSLWSLLTISLLTLYPHPLWVQCMKFDDMVNLGRNYLNIHACNSKVHETSQQGKLWSCFNRILQMFYMCPLIYKWKASMCSSQRTLYVALHASTSKSIVPSHRTPTKNIVPSIPSLTSTIVVGANCGVCVWHWQNHM
jgi:hypothetical protein